MLNLKLVRHYRDEDRLEHFDFNPFEEVTEAQISEKDHTIKNVCAFGTRHSKNGYTYLDPAISKLAQLAEGAKWYINHPSKSESKERDGVRDVRDWAGVFRSPTQKEDRVYADLQVRPAFWELAKDIATMKPVGMGNSINARVRVFKDRESGQESVVDIDRLNSIDLVSHAATTTTLFESAKEKEQEMKEEFFKTTLNFLELNEEEILIGEKKQSEGVIYHFVSSYFEGLLSDRMKERAVQRKVSELNWRASNEIDNILRDAQKDMKQKKADITSIMDELESEINNILSGKKSILDKTETKTDNNKGDEDMFDFTKISLEDLAKERPDLVKAIEQSAKDGDKMETLENANKDLAAKNAELTKQVEDLTKAHDELKTESENLKKKLDEYETKEKKAAKEAMIAEKVKETKLPDEAVTDFFKESLMKLDEEGIDKALEDRKELWNKKPGTTPKQEEFTGPANTEDKKKKVETGIDSLVEAKRR